MLEEIKAGRLAGIYCVNWKKAAQRALRFGGSWWTVIPRDKDAVLMLDPDNLSSGPPLIAFRRELDPRPEQGCGRLPNENLFPPSPARLDAALLKTWLTYTFWRNGKLALCSSQVAAGLPNNDIVPPGYCTVQQPTVPTKPPESICRSGPAIPVAFIKWLQNSLNRMGFRSPATGILDTHTRDALRTFQLRKGLPPSGTPDFRTVRAFKEEGIEDAPCTLCGCTDPGRWWEIIPGPGQTAADAGAAQSAIDTIRSNRVNITLRFFIPEQGGEVYTTRRERSDPNASTTQRQLAQSYLNWLATNPWRSGKQADRKTRVQLNLFEDLIAGEGDPASINTWDQAVLSWGVGFAGGSSLEKVIANVFRRSSSARDAFLCNGITLTNDGRLAVVDTSAGVVVEDRLLAPGKRSADARLIIKQNPQLLSLFVNVTQGVDFAPVKCVDDVRQAIVDAEFDTFKTINTGQIPDEVWRDWERLPSNRLKQRQAIAVAGHNIHLGGMRRKGKPPIGISWNDFKRLKLTTVQGVVAVLGLKFGGPNRQGVTEISPTVTFKRIMRLGRGWGRSALSGPHVIAGYGPGSPCRDVMLNPPAGFGDNAWRDDYLYFRAKICEGKPNKLTCDLPATTLLRRTKQVTPRGQCGLYQTFEVFYLVPKKWGDKK
jgi:peptidoglycan hydrolase-like protein with peptidoglycan-binding domain